MSKGKLYICGTPIGNLDDITFRAIKTLEEVDIIAAEDTRRTEKLLNYYQINNRLVSYHEHNEKERTPQLMSELEQCKDVALVSDAGMPGISDPGQEIINRAIQEGIEVIPIPGPTAAISALVVSGLSMESFVFEGFIPRKGKVRQQFMEQIQQENRTLIFYESPYRIKNTLKELVEVSGDRRTAVIREISKVHEEKIYGTPASILKNLRDREVKGEIVVVIEGRKTSKIEKEGWEDLSILEHVELLMENGYTKKKAIKKVASTRDIQKKKVYKEAIAIDARRGK